MKNLDQIFYSKKGIEHISKYRDYYRYDSMKIKTLVKLHLYENKKSKLDERRNHLKIFLIQFGNTNLYDLKTIDLRKWLLNYKIEKSYTEKNMCHIKCQLNHFFKWLYENEYTTKNLIADIKFKQNLPPKKPRVVLSAEEIKELLNSAHECSSKILYPFLYTIVQTGARRSEVVNLCWKDVDFATNRLTFRETKNGESRSIEMSKGLRRLLESLRLKDLKHQYVFINEEGRKLHRQKIHRMVTKLKMLYPIPAKDWGCHALRHSFAYNFLKKGGEMYQLKAILGHKTITMTVDLYGNLKSQDIENPSPYDF